MSTETLTISKANALTAFSKANTDGRQLLSNLFGETVFSMDIKDRIRTFEDACFETGVNPEEIVIDLSGMLSDDQEAIVDYCKMRVVAKALNEGWKPDWNNPNQPKYYPWFEMRSGFGFSGTYTYWSDTGTDVGSRLCFKSKELAAYAGKQFETLYKSFLTK